MMKNLFFPTAALLALLSACSERTEPATPPEALNQEQTQEQEQLAPTSATVHIVINGIQEGEPSTKTVLADNLKTVLWMPGDDIKVFCDDWTEPARFISTNDTPAAETTFEADVTMEDPDASGIGDYWAVYPYSDEARFEGGEFYASLPASQVAVDNSFADDLFVSVAHCSAVDDMHFYNVCSGFKFSLDREDITSVTFTATGGEAVAGDFSVTFDADALPVITSRGDLSSVTLVPPAGETFFAKDTWYYIVLVPQKLSDGFSLTFEGLDDNGNAIAPIRLSSAAPLTLTRSHFPKSALKIANTIDVDIETPEIRAFLEDPVIDELYTSDTEYTGTEGDRISCSAKPVTFNWAATGARTLYISETKDFADAKSFTVGASSTSTSVYNLVPGVTYYCRTVSASGNTVWETSFVPVGPFRAISVSGASNTRDLGGWKTADGKTVRYGKLFRGTAPSSNSGELIDLGVGLEMDLRGYPGTTGSPNSSCPFGAGFINRPVCQFMYGESSHEPGVSADDYQQAIREIIYCLKEGVGVYFHCIGGADRTGTLSYLILALLGVEEADLCKEYELTGDRTRDNNGRYPFKQLVFYLKGFTEYTDPYTGEMREAQTLQEMVTTWALADHTDENDGITGSPFEPLTMKEIDLLKELMLENPVPEDIPY